MATKPTAAEVEKFFDLTKKRRDLDRQSRLLEAESKPLYEKLMAYVKEHSGVKKCLTLWGFVCKLLTRPGRVAWKEAFVTRCGADEAAKLQSAVEPSEYLECEAASE